MEVLSGLTWERGKTLFPRVRRVFQIFVCCPCCGPCTGPGHVLPCKTHQDELFREILERR